MSKTSFIIFKIKNIILPACICLFTIFLIIFSRENLSATKSGLELWADSVLPSLLPFFIATELLNHTDVVFVLGKLLNKLMRPLFNVPGEGAYPFLMGIISGYPVGAKIISDFKENNICSSIECERLLSFTNNSGPLFIVGTVGITLFGNTSIGILLLFTHILSCITVGILFRWWKCDNGKYYNNKLYRNNSTISNISFSNLGLVLSISIMKAVNTVVMIGGFVVLFSVILSILENSQILPLLSDCISPILNTFGIPNIYSSGIVSGIIELTNGVQSISSICSKTISLNIILCSFLLGLGGISVFLQVLSITSKSNTSIKPYIIGKLLQACFAALYTFMFVTSIPFFNFDL